jgi:hypothetical protein
MESMFKMAILRLSIRLSEPCIFAIFRPTLFKFWIIIEEYIRFNETFGFFDLLSISSETEFRLGPSQIRIFKIVFHHLLRIFPIAVKFKVDPIIYFGNSNHKKIIYGKNKMAEKIDMAAKHEFSITQ